MIIRKFIYCTKMANLKEYFQTKEKAKNQKYGHNYINKETYNANNEYNSENLKYDLSVILRAFKKALK